MNNGEQTTQDALSPMTRRRFVGVAAAAAGAAATGSGLIGGQQAQAAPACSSDVVSWVNRHARPLWTLDPEAPLFDMYPLRRIVGKDAQIVGMGYGAHGTETLTRVHHRAIRFLVKHMGFRTLAWEESWGAGVDIDRYVADGKGDPQAAHDVILKAFPQLRHQGIVDIVRWLSEFNAHRPAHDRVRFIGTDSLEVRQFLYDRVTQYVTDVAPNRIGELNEHLDPLRMHGDPQATIMWYLDPNKTEDWRDEIVAKAKAMFEFVKSMPDAKSEVAYLDAVQDAQNILGFYDFLSWKGTLSDSREYYISETINRWIKRDPNKMIYVAHNGHIAANREMIVSIVPVDMNRKRTLSGWMLRRDYGSRYVPIGTTFNEGVIFVGWQDGSPADYVIPPADPSLLDHTFSLARPHNFLLDLNAPGRESPEVRRFLDGRAKIRFIASPYDPKLDAEYKQEDDPLRNEGYAAMFHADEVETARMFGL